MSLRYPLLFFAVLLSACRGSAPQADADNRLPSPTAIGQRSPLADVRWLKGDELGRLARAYGGKGTLFNIWATWCGSCKGEFPTMKQLAEQYAKRGIQVVPVSVDEPEQMDKLAHWIQARGFLTPAWLAARPLGTFKASVAATWLGNIPITLLYDAQGNRRYFWDGPVELTEVTAIVDGFLDGKQIDGEKHYSLSAGITDPVPSAALQ